MRYFVVTIDNMTTAKLPRKFKFTRLPQQKYLVQKNVNDAGYKVYYTFADPELEALTEAEIGSPSMIPISPIIPPACMSGILMDSKGETCFVILVLNYPLEVNRIQVVSRKL